jgi:hypothetical protein
LRAIFSNDAKNAQMFVISVRALNIGARLVCSLQPMSLKLEDPGKLTQSQGKSGTAKKIKEKKV